MKEITVKSQKELDDIPITYGGRIIIDFGKPYDRAVVKKRYIGSVIATDNSYVVLCNSSSITAKGNSRVDAYGNSLVIAKDNSCVSSTENSFVKAFDNSYVEATGNSSVLAQGNSVVEANIHSSVIALDNSTVIVRDYSSVVASCSSSVVALNISSVVAYDDSHVYAKENSSVVAYGNSKIEAEGNVRVINYQNTENNIKLGYNSSIVYYPRTFDEYIPFHNLKSTEEVVTLYKVVMKSDSDGQTKYINLYNTNLEYHIGETIFANSHSINSYDDSSYGIHCSHLDWCLEYVSMYKGAVILELEVQKCDIINSNMIYIWDNVGEIRAYKAKVIREVPLEECGLYGKTLLKK